MRTTLRNKNLSQRPAARTLLAVSLSLTLAAFGCTTDRTLGNGDPVTTPGGRFTPSGGVTSGSESAPSIPPPMMSSSTYSSVSSQALPRVQSRSVRRLTPDEAALIMAEHAPRVRVLGPAMPGPANRPYESDRLVTGQFINPALQTNPQLTINSSISSPATPAISSGAGEVGGGDLGGAIIAGATVGTTANSGLTVGGNATATTAGAALIATPTGTAVSPTAAALPLPAGAFAATTVSPTAASVVNPGATISASPALAAQRSATMNTVNAGAARTAATTATNAATTTNASSTNTVAGTTVGSASATVSPVRMVTDSNGRRVMTNATGRASTTTTTTRPQ